MLQDDLVYAGIFALVFVMSVGWTRSVAPNWYGLYKDIFLKCMAGFCVAAAIFFIATSAMHIQPLGWLFR